MEEGLVASTLWELSYVHGGHMDFLLATRSWERELNLDSGHDWIDELVRRAHHDKSTRNPFTIHEAF